MRIVIDIDDAAYKFVQSTSFVEDESTMFGQTNADREKTLLLFDILSAIKNGTPIPKGHGRLIDAERYRKEMLDSREFNFFKTLDMQLTIIEADKAKSEDKLDGDPIDIDKAVEHYEGTLETLKGIDLEDKK